jgi:hypothetical protein
MALMPCVPGYYDRGGLGPLADSLIRASLPVVWLQFGVSGFRPVLAWPWHAVWLQTTGACLLVVNGAGQRGVDACS